MNPYITEFRVEPPTTKLVVPEGAFSQISGPASTAIETSSGDSFFSVGYAVPLASNTNAVSVTLEQATQH